MSSKSSFVTRVVLVIVIALGVYVLTGPVASSSRITISGASPGAVFDGVGAISGGGGETRYLSDYPAAQRNQIFKDLFAPDYGASLQILKVEIGGDANSTDGAELSVEHSPGVVDCNAGYEWQFMEEARSLNPAIKIYGLAWAAPGWINQFFSRQMIGYLLTWLGCAHKHGIAVNYLGGWNEHTFEPSQMSWFEALRRALNRHGYRGVQIVAADTFDWNAATAMAHNKAFARAVSIIGVHDSCQYPTTGIRCYSSKTAQSLHKPIWASELGAMNGNSGAPDMVRAIIRGHLDARMTGFITWPIMMSLPADLPLPNYGLITADQPWSGNYSVNEMTWGIGQITQFTQPGWRYIDGASGYFGHDRDNGSYVTLRSNTSDDWSMIAETTTAPDARNITVTVRPGLARRVVHVWATNLETRDSSQWFRHVADLYPINGQFKFQLQPGYVYTFTTTTGQSRGGMNAAIPHSKAFPVPYHDSFTDPDSSGEARYLATMDGAFASAPCEGGIAGTCIEQETPQAPIYWHPHDGFPFAVMGDKSLANYRVSVRVLFPTTSSSAGLIGRFQSAGFVPNEFDGYVFNVHEDGQWQLIRNTGSGYKVVRSGDVGSLGVDRWNALSLTVDGAQLDATVNGVTVLSMTLKHAYKSGLPGIETDAFSGNWSAVQFRDFALSAAGR